MIPEMPIHSEPENAYLIYTVLMATITAAVLAFWLLTDERRRFGPMLPLLLIGGAVAAILEPVFDNLILYWYPPEHSSVAFEAYGRAIPWFVPIGYAWFIGGLPYLAYRIYLRGITARGVWAVFGAVYVIDALAISLAGWIGTSGFYGNQPFNFWGEYPLWWGALDGAQVVVGGAILFFLAPHLSGPRALWYVLIPLVALGVALGVVAPPIALALNSTWGDLATHLAGAASFGLGLSLVYLASKVVPRATGAATRSPV